MDLFFVTRVFVFLLFLFGYVLARDISKTFTINSWGWCVAILEYRSVFSDSFINFIVSPVFRTVSAVTNSLKCRVNPMYFSFQLSVVCTINESLFVVLFRSDCTDKNIALKVTWSIKIYSGIIFITFKNHAIDSIKNFNR